MSEPRVRRSSGAEHIYGHPYDQIRDPWSDHQVFWFGGALVVVCRPDGGIIIDIVNLTIDGYERRARYARMQAAGRGRRPRSRRTR